MLISAADVDDGGGKVCDVMTALIAAAAGGGGEAWKAEATFKYLRARVTRVHLQAERAAMRAWCAGAAVRMWLLRQMRADAARDLASFAI